MDKKWYRAITLERNAIHRSLTQGKQSEYKKRLTFQKNIPKKSMNIKIQKKKPLNDPNALYQQQQNKKQKVKKSKLLNK